jgi:hypothetical protein
MTIVSDILQQMRAVRQPQRKFLMVLFTTILALRGRVTGRNLSRYCAYSERTIARQFRVTFDWPDFHQRVRTTALDPRSALISAQDASFIAQSGKPTFGLGYFFNGCANRAEPGLEISTLAVVDVTRRGAFTLAVAQTPPGKVDGKKDKRENETRRDFYQQQLHAQRHRLPSPIRYHCVDGYFAQQKYRDEVVALNLPPIPKLRPAANCLFLYPGPHPKRRGRRRKYDGKVNFHDLSRFAALGPLAEKPHIPLYTALGWHVSLKRQLPIVVLVNRKEATNPRYIVLASTDLTLHGRKLVALYVARFQIEFLFRDSKQCTGLADCQSRAEAVLDFHFTAALATLNLARAEDLRAQPELTPHVFSLASWKQRHFNERLLEVFIDNLALDPMWVKNHPGYEKLRTYGAIAA